MSLSPTRTLLDGTHGGESVAQLLAALPDGPDAAGAEGMWPTGFDPLDTCLAGGLRAGELAVLGGAPSAGKTTFALQLARNIAAGGTDVLFVCYEHPERQLVMRLLAMEIGLHDASSEVDVLQVRRTVEAGDDLTSVFPSTSAAIAGLDRYAGRIHLVRGTRYLDLEALQGLVRSHASGAPAPILVVDYLQKVPTAQAHDHDAKVTVVTEGLKELALDVEVPVITIVASDRQGLGATRTRLQHLRGSTAIAYEADVALMLNDKYSVVARHHLVYGAVQPERFHDWMVLSIEKNRSGRDHVDMEFRKCFHQARFDPAGRFVAEQLVDERLNLD